jgi:hypothetical protein
MVARLLHDAVFEPSTKVYTAAQTKLNGILRKVECDDWNLYFQAMDGNDDHNSYNLR